MDSLGTDDCLRDLIDMSSLAKQCSKCFSLGSSRRKNMCSLRKWCSMLGCSWNKCASS